MGRGKKSMAKNRNKNRQVKARARKSREQTAAAIKGGQVMALGLEAGPAVGVALTLYKELEAAVGPEEAMSQLEQVINHPTQFAADANLGLFATSIIEQREARAGYVPRAELAPGAIFGDDLEQGALDQYENARRLPVAHSAALMPDAHQGYGLPIGGVLATHNSVIPYAVGVDIGCRMRLTIFDVPAQTMPGQHQRLVNILERETLFGTGKQFDKPYDHEVMDEDKWQISDVVRKVRDKAGAQLGSSGSGNHFVSFDTISFPTDAPEMGLKAGEYMCVLSHSGSRGAGATIADYYSKLAMAEHPELPPELRRLAWLDMDAEGGQEYWAAMSLMGDYAAANHEVIHKKIERALGEKVLFGVENHHNLAWKEEHGGEEVYVHRKGATPAGVGVMGIIPGSMATPGFMVRGKGEATSLRSASHGAGRAMSRTAAKNKFRWAHVRPQLEEAGVTLLSAGIDEVPGSYKDIHKVMAAQTALVDVVARFDPKIVKMADGKEKPED